MAEADRVQQNCIAFCRVEVLDPGPVDLAEEHERVRAGAPVECRASLGEEGIVPRTRIQVVPVAPPELIVSSAGMDRVTDRIGRVRLVPEVDDRDPVRVRRADDSLDAGQDVALGVAANTGGEQHRRTKVELDAVVLEPTNSRGIAVVDGVEPVAAVDVVRAGGGDDPIVTAIAADGILAVAAVQRVVAAAAAKDIVSSPALDPVVVLVAVE